MARKHTVRLMGPERGGLRVPASTLVKLLETLTRGSQQSLRLRVEGESTKRGSKPAWLDSATNFVVTGLHEGSAVLEVEAPTLAEADSQLFGGSKQATLIDSEEPLNSNQSAVDVFAESLSQALARRADSSAIDKAILQTCVDFGEVASDEFSAVEISSAVAGGQPVIVDSIGVSVLRQLYTQAPEPQAARLTGRLDTISATRPWIVLVLEDGEKVRAKVDPFSPDQLHSLFGNQVVVSGMAHFRASGRLWKIDVEYVTAAEGNVTLWKRPPTPRLGRLDVASLRQVQDSTTGVSAFFGIWPGDESDEELQAALKRMG